MTEYLSDVADDDWHRRFQGTETLYGLQAVDAFKKAHVFVVGVGGVGTWVAEALARTAIGELTLVDLDVLVESNVNRQLPAMSDLFGQSKVEAMADRIQKINPRVRVNLVDDFLTQDNVADILPSRQFAKMAQAEGRAIVVLDCVDDMSAKIAMALHCRFNKLKLVCAGGAGGKTDPLQVSVSDLKDTYQDSLLARLRYKLRHEYGINKQLKEKFGIKCVYSTQPPITSNSHCLNNGLRCGGYGSAVTVTSVVGMVMVNEALNLIYGQRS